uniref:Uncharacterized protein n=2 Tax=Corethron hystrix TaxID=216773 RepID=A0A7S1B3Q3_9STRA|mmetsp:Transcript_11702/g.25678  ORF Transcript_11702/g.25678 Transcript_11702/m.25678 type:complete len:335 (+) Transcript_11702:258-1262(+)
MLFSRPINQEIPNQLRQPFTRPNKNLNIQKTSIYIYEVTKYLLTDSKKNIHRLLPKTFKHNRQLDDTSQSTTLTIHTSKTRNGKTHYTKALPQQLHAASPFVLQQNQTTKTTNSTLYPQLSNYLKNNLNSDPRRNVLQILPFPQSDSSRKINLTNLEPVEKEEKTKKTLVAPPHAYLPDLLKNMEQLQSQKTNFWNILLPKINCGLHILSSEINYETTASKEKIRHHTPVSTSNFSYHLETVVSHRNRSHSTTHTNIMSKTTENSLVIQEIRTPQKITDPYHYYTLYISLLSKSLYSQQPLNRCYQKPSKIPSILPTYPFSLTQRSIQLHAIMN